MEKTPRNNSHATSACVHCRKRKTRCDGDKPSCGACARKREECEYTPDRDRRTARGRTCASCETRVPALEAENAQLRAQLARFQASAGAPERAAHDAPQTAQHATCAAPPMPVTRLDANEQLSFPGQPFDLFPLTDAQILEVHPIEPTAASSQAVFDPRWLQEALFLQTLSPALDPLAAGTLSAFPQPQMTEANLDSRCDTPS